MSGGESRCNTGAASDPAVAPPPAAVDEVSLAVNGWLDDVLPAAVDEESLTVSGWLEGVLLLRIGESFSPLGACSL